MSESRIERIVRQWAEGCVAEVRANSTLVGYTIAWTPENEQALVRALERDAEQGKEPTT